MADVLAEDLAQAPRGLVIAPAGCGKTHLISQAVGYSKGRQLVLTHTHAGVAAIRARMVRLGIPATLYRVVTIDSFALKYAAAFPTLSNWATREPEGEQWTALRPAGLKACQSPAVIDVLKATYAGVYVDEYQDCTRGQHDLVMQLSALLPCRILGDPLQAIFRRINKEEALPWQTVCDSFAELGTLESPRRWVGQNEALGQWLFATRTRLLAGEVVDLRNAPGIDLRLGDPNEAFQIAVCYELAKRGSSAVALRGWRHQCHRLSGRLNNTFHAVEDAQCEDLVEWGREIEAVTGPQRTEKLVDFAGRWLTRLPSSLVAGVAKAVKDQKPCRAKRSDAIALFEALRAARDEQSPGSVVRVLDAFTSLEEKPVFKSKEIWCGLRKAADEAGRHPGTSLSQAIGAGRERARHHGRDVGRHCLATPLLVKGLEFDHVAILNAADFKDAELAYVSLTRACRSMIVLSRTPTLHLARPGN